MKIAKISAVMCTLALAAGFAFAAAAEPINDKCPMSGRDVNPSKTVSVEVGFCCGNCQGKFEKAPGKYLAKVAKTPEGKCPMSGKNANPSKTAKVTVGFCCGNCQKKFAKAPRKNLAKVKPAEKKDS